VRIDATASSRAHLARTSENEKKNKLQIDAATRRADAAMNPSRALSARVGCAAASPVHLFDLFFFFFLFFISLLWFLVRWRTGCSSTPFFFFFLFYFFFFFYLSCFSRYVYTSKYRSHCTCTGGAPNAVVARRSPTDRGRAANAMPNHILSLLLAVFVLSGHGGGGRRRRGWGGGGRGAGRLWTAARHDSVLRSASLSIYHGGRLWWRPHHFFFF